MKNFFFLRPSIKNKKDKMILQKSFIRKNMNARTINSKRAKFSKVQFYCGRDQVWLGDRESFAFKKQALGRKSRIHNE